MGLFGKKEASASVEEKKVSQGTIIAPGMLFEGDFDTDEQLDIQGTVKGFIRSSVDAHVSEGGKHIGKMAVNTLHVDGELSSDVVCAEMASLSETANFNGKLKTPKFDAAYGSSFEGTLSLEAKKEEPTPQIVED